MNPIADARIIIFDNDGTLVPSHEFANPAIQEAFVEFCRRGGVAVAEPTDARLRELTGLPGEAFYRELLPGELRERASDLRSFCLDWEVAGIRETGRFYEGLGEMLAELRRRGRRLAVATHGGDRYIAALSRRLGYDTLFDRVFFHGFEGLTSKADMARRALSELGPGPGLFVGDRRADLDAAREASIPFVGCSYGYGSADELRDADALASSPAGLARLLLDSGR